MYTARVLAFAAAAALLAACGGGNGGQSVPGLAASPPREASSHALTMLTPYTAVDRESGATLRLLPPRGILGGTRQSASIAASTSNNLLYGGGPIQTAPHLYVVFWGSSWNSPTGDPNGVMARMKSFYATIGGSAWLNSVTQYTQSDGSHAGNAGNIFLGSYVDTSSSPLTVVTQSQLAAEAAKAAARYGDYSPSASYVVVTPHGVTTPGFKVQFCAYHSTTTAGGKTVSWTFMPYIPDAGTSCGQGSVNTPGTLDGVTIVGGHEQGEVESDPQPSTGWVDASGAENGDKCAWTGLVNNSTTGGYPTQPLWSNANNGCVQTY